MNIGCRVQTLAISLLTFTALTGCNPKANEADLPYRFTVGPFGLGMAKDSIRDEKTLRDCKPKDRRSAVCTSTKVGSDATFFGRPTKSIELDFAVPYTRLTGIKAIVTGKPISAEEVRKAWAMDDQCLTKDQIQTAVAQDSGASSLALDVLSANNALPVGPTDFVCIRGDDQLRYTWDENSKEGTVVMSHGDHIVSLNYEYIIKAVDNLRAAQEQISKQFSTKSGKPQSKSCTAYASMDRDKQDELLTRLASHIKADKISYRGLSTFVDGLCDSSGQIDWAVEWGALTLEQAEKIAKEMDVIYSGRREPSPFAPRYNKAMDALTTAGLCNGCTYRPSMKYALEPYSECASYVAELMASTGEKAGRIKQVLETDEAMCK